MRKHRCLPPRAAAQNLPPQRQQLAVAPPPPRHRLPWLTRPPARSAARQQQRPGLQSSSSAPPAQQTLLAPPPDVHVHDQPASPAQLQVWQVQDRDLLQQGMPSQRLAPAQDCVQTDGRPAVDRALIGVLPWPFVRHLKPQQVAPQSTQVLLCSKAQVARDTRDVQANRLPDVCTRASPSS